jgi:hypothetical protein
MATGHVYFVENPQAGAVKIGFTAQPRSRFSALRSVNLDKLNVLGLFPGSVEHEKFLHRLYKRDRIKGEWFTKSDGLLETIDLLRKEGWNGINYEPAVQVTQKETSRVQKMARDASACILAAGAYLGLTRDESADRYGVPWSTMKLRLYTPNESATQDYLTEIRAARRAAQEALAKAQGDLAKFDAEIHLWKHFLPQTMKVGNGR